MDDIEELRKAIRNLHGCDSKYVESVPVTESFQGRTVWEGFVEVFDLVGHSKARRCYAWAHRDGRDDRSIRYITVLEIQPVDSPLTAVRASIVSEAKTDKRCK